ncbi:MAG: hypothetical protein HYU52_02160 [Acidobacteria bacterium]|nr:hypothetical protein [Acidobacteriota bacterium]
MRCDEFRVACQQPEELGCEALAHMRACEPCLNHAIAADPDLMFRGLGGELSPDGGTDAFVEGVMHEIRFRKAERIVDARHRFATTQRWAIAAAVVVAVVSGAIFWPRADRVIVPGAPSAVIASAPASLVVPVSSKPAIESYGSSSAMIVEVPFEETSDLKVVMIFDESLPADL